MNKLNLPPLNGGLKQQIHINHKSFRTTFLVSGTGEQHQIILQTSSYVAMVLTLASIMALSLVKSDGCLLAQVQKTIICGREIVKLKDKNSSNTSCSFLKRQISTKTENANEYCINLVRRHDYENFLCTLLYPKELRTIGFAVRAFNVEVAQVRDMVSDVKIGEMRMQFWKDAIDKTFSGNPPHHPVTLQLAQVLRKKTLSKHWLKRMIECRAKMLIDQPFSSLQDVETYYENSVSSIYYVILEGVGLNNVHSDHAASHVGKAQGLTNLIRGIPFNARHGRIYLPNDIMIKHNLSQEDVFRGKKEDLLRAVVYDIACVAHQHVEKFKSLKNEVSKDSSVIFLPLIATQQYLVSLEKANFNVFHRKLQHRNNLLPYYLLLNKIFKK